MKVVLIVYSHYSRDARVRRYAEALAQKNIKVDILCLREDYQPKESNINLFHYPLPRRRFGRIWNIFEYVLFFSYTVVFFTLLYFIRRWEVIHVNNMPEVLVFTTFIPKLFGSRIILDMHDPMPELYMSKYHASENNLMVKWLKWLEGLSLKFTDHILTANEEFKKIFLSRHKIDSSKISVILNCPDRRIFSKEVGPLYRGPTSQHFTLLYMGTVEERFGLDIVIDAMPELIKKIPNIKFIIIPKLEEEGEYFRNLIPIQSGQNSKLKKFIQILPPIPLEEIADMLKKADIGIVLAKNGVFTDKIFPVKLLEFIQMRIPVIATKTHTLAKYFDNKSIYFLENNTPEEFKKAVIDLYKGKKLRKTLRDNALKYLKIHNWEKEKQKYYNILELC